MASNVSGSLRRFSRSCLVDAIYGFQTARRNSGMATQNLTRQLDIRELHHGLVGHELATHVLKQHLPDDDDHCGSSLF